MSVSCRILQILSVPVILTLLLLIARVLVLDGRQDYATGTVSNLVVDGDSTGCDSIGRGAWAKTQDRQEEQDCNCKITLDLSSRCDYFGWHQVCMGAVRA